MVKDSSAKPERQILGVISPRKAERLLTDWANLAGEWPRVENEESLRKTSEQIDYISRRHPDIFEDCTSIVTIVLREFLRKAWSASDLRHRDWFMFRFRDHYQQTVLRVQTVRTDRNSGLVPSEMPVILPSRRNEALESTGPRNDPPPVTPVEAAAFYFQRNAHRARRCANPECEAPYFLAGKKRQKFCSEVCALPALLESKRKWWSENRSKNAKKKNPKKRAASVQAAPTRR